MKSHLVLAAILLAANSSIAGSDANPSSPGADPPTGTSK
jgi:hypothetical protein